MIRSWQQWWWHHVVRRENILLLATDEKNYKESFYVELNLRNEKWLINSLCNPKKTMTCNHLDWLSTYLDLYSTTYEKVLILGNFNVGIEEQHMKAFCDNYNLTSLIKQPTSYKNPSNPTYIDLILSNIPTSFQSTCVIETRLSVSHLMTLTVMKKRFSTPDLSIIGPTKTPQMKPLGNDY